jgi:hypothetical protein
MAVILAMATLSLYVHAEKQTDFLSMYTAASAFKSGVNPYDMAALGQMAHQDDVPIYRYPPYTLYLFRPFTWFSFVAAARIFLLLKFVALGALLYLWHRLFDLTRYRGLLWVLVPLAFNCTVIADFRSGNISVFEQLLIWTGFYFYTRKSLAGFGIAIVLAASCKLVPIALLALLATRWNKKSLAYGVLFGVAFLALLGASALAWPELFAIFWKNLLHLGAQGEHGNVDPSTRALISDAARWFQLKTGHPLPIIIPLGILATLAAGVVAVSVIMFSRMKSSDSKSADLWRISLLCLSYALIVPRFKDYSYILLIPPAFYIITARKWINDPVLPFCGLLVIFTLRDFRFYGTILEPFFRFQGEYYCLVLAWVLWGMCCYCIWRETEAPRPPRADKAGVISLAG